MTPSHDDIPFGSWSEFHRNVGRSGDDIKLPVLKNCPLWLETAMVAFEKAKDHLVNGSGTHPEGYSLYLTLKRQGFPKSIKEDASRNKDTDILAKKLATKAQMPSFSYRD